MQAKASLLARLLSPDAPRTMTITPSEVIIENRHGAQRLPHEAVWSITTIPGMVWSTVRVLPRDASTPTITMRWAPRRPTAMMRAWYQWGLGPRVHAAAATFRSLLDRNAYFNHNAWMDWRSSPGVSDPLPPEADTEVLPEETAREFRYCRHVLSSGERMITDRNELYVQSKKAEHRSWFAQAGGQYGLTDEQQVAILKDEDNCLVVAGAGTGKTSTVAGKVGYLLRTGAATSEKILLLSFTRKAADEMRERIATTVGADVTVRTFHSLGLEIVSWSEGKRPALARFVDDPLLLAELLTRIISELLGDSKARNHVLEFFAYYLHPYRSPFEFSSKHEYYQYVRGHELRTFRGELVKSHEELIIANWLYLNGIDYAYERDYPHDTASIQHRQYRPDFYLPRYDLYLEHFGVDRRGNTAPGVDPQKYHEEMVWKRATHAKYGTRLLESYSYEQMEGTLLDSLEEKLKAVGVISTPLAPGASREAVARLQLVDPLTRLLSTFLSLFKGNLYTLDELRNAAETRHGGRAPDRLRTVAFLRVFELVLDAYERELRLAGEIDFNDMIKLATECVSTGKYQSPFSHIIVDEFQDLSRGRGRLLQALLGQVDNRRLFCVGDDWQSIYRFTGSDIGQMTEFEDTFGHSERTDLTRTHRLNQELLEATAMFVQRNPAQLRKRLHAERRLGGPAIEVHGVSDGALPSDLLDSILERIAKVALADRAAKGSAGSKPTVLVLGRYRHTLPERNRELERKHHGLSIRWLTVHTSKGLEADYVVLLDVVNGKFGFPAEIVDDPVLDLVLAAGGDFENAEERRLFYVALTRARHRAFVLTDASRRSKFVDELTGPGYERWVHASSDAGSHTGACQECGGPLVRRSGPHGYFWGCSNFPLCKGTARMCPKCGRAPLIRQDKTFRCAAPGCGAAFPVCPSCGVGSLQARKGPTGMFYGCSEWRPTGAGTSCTYTRRRI